MDRKFRLARVWSNDELKKFSHLFEGKVINVSAGENIDKQGSNYKEYFKNANEFWMSNYAPGKYRGFEGRPNEILLDLEEPLDPELEDKFDVVFNHTTLEHVFDIFTAFKNLVSLSSDIVIVVVPFAQVQHESDEGYYDFWRFSPTGLRQLFERNDMKVLYESATPHTNAGIYLFMVGSKNPNFWEGKFPQSSKLWETGNWIGEVNKNPGISRRILNRLRGRS